MLAAGDLSMCRPQAGDLEPVSAGPRHAGEPQPAAAGAEAELVLAGDREGLLLRQADEDRGRGRARGRAARRNHQGYFV